MRNARVHGHAGYLSAAIAIVLVLAGCSSAKPEDLEELLAADIVSLLPEGVELVERETQDTLFPVFDLTGGHPSQVARVRSTYQAEDPEAAFLEFAEALAQERYCHDMTSSATTTSVGCSFSASYVKLVDASQGIVVVTLAHFARE